MTSVFSRAERTLLKYKIDNYASQG